MNSLRMPSVFLASIATALITVACGQGSVLNSPTGPSGVSGPMMLGADAATASSADVADVLAKGGNGGGNNNSGNENKGNKGQGGSDESEQEQEPGVEIGSHVPGHVPGERGMLSGFVQDVDADSLVIRDVEVLVTLDTVIRHGNTILTLADVEIGDHAQARGTMSVDGTQMTATEVKVEDTGNDNVEGTDNDVELEGAVTGLSGSCVAVPPGLTFTIGTTVVKTDASTAFDDVTCATLANTNLVRVEGTVQLDGTVLAEEVELQSGPDELVGFVSGLAGGATCLVPPIAVTFTIGTTTVTVNDATLFNGALTCAKLANGQRVEVEGTLGATLVAASVEPK